MEIKKTLYFLSDADFKMESVMHMEAAKELLFLCERAILGTSRIYEFNAQKIAILNPEYGALTVFEGAASDIAELASVLAARPSEDVIAPAPGEKGALKLK